MRANLSVNICPACKGNANPDNAILCTGCSQPYHQSCSARTSKLDSGAFSKCCGPPSRSASPIHSQDNDILVAIAKLGEKLRSEIKTQIDGIKNDTSHIRESLDSLSARIINLETTTESINLRTESLEFRVDSIDKLIPTLPTQGKLDTQSDKLVRELNDRHMRRRNLIVYNMPESADKSKDLESFRSLAKLISNDCINAIKFCVRLGRFNNIANKIRPLKIIFQTEKHVDSFVDDFWKCKQEVDKYPGLTQYTISRDKTPQQAAEYQTLRAEMHRRMNSGETNLKIITYGGIQKIIKTKQ